MTDDTEWDWPEWEPREGACPQCGSPIQTRPWWDDPPDVGGACIGEQLSCVNPTCDWGVDL